MRAAVVVVLLSMAAGCGLNSAGRPVGVRPDVTSVIMDPVTLRPVKSKPVTPAGEGKPAGREGLDDKSDDKPDDKPDDKLDARM